MFYSPNFTCIPFHSLEGNEIGDSVATALADALTVNQSLTTLRYVWHVARYFWRTKSLCCTKLSQRTGNFYIHLNFEPRTKAVDKILLAPCPLSAIVQLCQAVTSSHGLSPARKFLTNSSIVFAHLKNAWALPFHC